jgi:hypothetical protein
VNPYLDNLVDLGLVQRRTLPRDGNLPRPRTSQYVLADAYLRFYYSLVDPWRSPIQQGQGRAVLNQLWPESVDSVVSWTFEEVARQYLRRLSGARRVGPLSDVAFWWFSGGDIDAAGMSNNRFVAAASAKWTRAFVKPGDLEDLRRSVALADPHADPDLYLMSRSGFDRNLAGSKRVHLIRMVDLFQADLEYERIDRVTPRRPLQMKLDFNGGSKTQ